MVIRMATDNDRNVLEGILQKSDLNDDGIEEKHTYFLIAEEEINSKKEVIAIAGIEQRGPYGFLRSLVLESKVRDFIKGYHFIASIIQYAKKLNFKELYLLTGPHTKKVFEYLNFQSISIHEVPDEVRESSHFTRSYNDSVIIMKNY